MKVIIEKQIEKCDEYLYNKNCEYKNSFDGFKGVNEEAMLIFKKEGFLIVRNAFEKTVVEKAKRELREMTFSDDPRVSAIYFEGSIRSKISGNNENNSDPNVKENPDFEDLALGFSTGNLPVLPPDIRSRYVRKFMGFVHSHDSLGAIALHRDLMAIIRKLICAPVTLFQDMAMIKPPGGREKPWHQDHAYFNLPVATNVIGVWTALGNATPENGCMHIWVGGHKFGPKVHFMRRDWQICDSELRNQNIMALPMEAGDVLIFDSKLPHGTPTNKTQDWRWALQFHYRPVSAKEILDEERLAVFGNEGKNVTC